jgi:DNA repair exonuclease SbcCD ATPase subunit
MARSRRRAGEKGEVMAHDPDAGRCCCPACNRERREAVDLESELERAEADLAQVRREAADAAERVSRLERENAELRELASRLLAAAEYYEPHKASWSEADEEHDEAISEARDALGPQTQTTRRS